MGDYWVNFAHFSSYLILKLVSANMSEKLRLQWNDFEENIKVAFGNLREDNDHTDVTLACEDGQQLEAHKVILAASSPFFQKLLGRNKHPHPLIYMRGVKSDDLSAIVDFLYCGEANVFQENLDSFLAISEELQLNGLMGKTDEEVKYFEADENPQPSSLFPAFDAVSKISKRQRPKGEEYGALSIPGNFSGGLDELEDRVRSMMEKSQNKIANGLQLADICKVCRKEGHGKDIKEHIEANHLEGIVIPCSLCNKTSRSRKGLRLHKSRHHN